MNSFERFSPKRLNRSNIPQIFDNEEYDCHTPGEWIDKLYDTDGTAKAVPGKALLKSLVTRETNSRGTGSVASETATTPVIQPTFQWVDVSWGTVGSRAVTSGAGNSVKLP